MQLTTPIAKNFTISQPMKSWSWCSPGTGDVPEDLELCSFSEIRTTSSRRYSHSHSGPVLVRLTELQV